MKGGRAAAVSALAALLVALPALRNGFAIDDRYLIVENGALASLSSIPRFFVAPWGQGLGGAGYATVNAAYYRPLATSLLCLERVAFGLRPWAWHLASALLHAGCTALVALLIARIASRGIVSPKEAPRAALVGGLLFALHPVHTEAIAAACYQTTLLSALLALGALVVFGRALDEGATPRRLIAIALLAAGALLAKEEAAALPLLGASFILLSRRERHRPALLAFAALAVGTGAAFAARSLVVVPSGLTYFGAAPRSAIALTMLGVFGLYGELLLVPLRLCVFYDWSIVPIADGFSMQATEGVAILLALALLIAWRRVPRAAAMGLAWLPLGLLPVMQLVPILNVAAERFLYLPSAGVALAAGALVDRAVAASARPRAWAIGLALAGALLTARSVTRLSDWRDDRTLDRATARDFPETIEPLLNLADLDEQAGDRAAAERDLAEAERRQPGSSLVARRIARLREAIAPR